MIMMVVGLLVIALLLSVLILLKRDKVLKKLIVLKDKFIWNGIIDMMTISYLDNCIWWAAFVQIENYEGPDMYPLLVGKLISHLVLLVLILQIFFCIFILWSRENEYLKTEETRKSYGNLYAEVNLWKKSGN
jgi:hypothetical protein